MQRFFTIAFEALDEENKFLKNNLSKTNLYDKWHHGLSFLFETTLVYLIFRKLLEKNFPYEVIWEDSYTHVRSLKADLALEHSEGKIYIEFKIWNKENAEDIETDLVKLYPLIKQGNRCFEFIVWRANKGEEEIHLNYLINESRFNYGLQLQKFECNHFETGFIDKQKKQTPMTYMVALFEVSIREN